MKKIFVVFLLIIVSLSSNAQKRIGGGLVFGLDIDQPGIVVNYEHFVTDNVAISPDFIYYFPEKVTVLGNSVSSSFWEINLNGHYYFMTGDTEIYGLGGLNYTNVKVETEVLGITTSVSDGDVGINLGGGINFGSGPIVPFAQMKFTIGSTDQLVIGGGVKFSLP